MYVRYLLGISLRTTGFVELRMYYFNTDTCTGVFDYAMGLTCTFKKRLWIALTCTNCATNEVQIACAFFLRRCSYVRWCYLMISLSVKTYTAASARSV